MGRGLLHAAYGCFLWVAFHSLLGEIAGHRNTSQVPGGEVTLFLLVLMIIPTLCVLLIAVILSIKLWREWPLVLLSASNLIYAGLTFSDRFDPVLPFLLVNLIVPLAWFVCRWRSPAKA
jgi:hypothetical protein